MELECTRSVVCVRVVEGALCNFCLASRTTKIIPERLHLNPLCSIPKKMAIVKKIEMVTSLVIFREFGRGPKQL